VARQDAAYRREIYERGDPARRCRVGACWAAGGTRRKDNNSCSALSTADKTKEPSGFCVAKNSPCRVGLREVTDQAKRLKFRSPEDLT
jgi:hypothetical protein